MTADQPPPWDPWDADLSVARDRIDDLGVDLSVWSYRREPDAHARRCASDAVDAIDTAIAALHRIRAGFVTEVRISDQAAAVRADELLAAKMRDGPQVVAPPGDHHPIQHPPGAEIISRQGTPGPGQDGEPREAAP